MTYIIVACLSTLNFDIAKRFLKPGPHDQIVFQIFGEFTSLNILKLILSYFKNSSNEYESL